MSAFKIGDLVWYRGSWGAQDGRLCTITGIGEKNNEVVYDNDLGHWGYADQYRAASAVDIANHVYDVFTKTL